MGFPYVWIRLTRVHQLWRVRRCEQDLIIPMSTTGIRVFYVRVETGGLVEEMEIGDGGNTPQLLDETNGKTAQNDYGGPVVSNPREEETVDSDTHRQRNGGAAKAYSVTKIEDVEVEVQTRVEANGNFTERFCFLESRTSPKRTIKQVDNLRTNYKILGIYDLQDSSFKSIFCLSSSGETSSSIISRLILDGNSLKQQPHISSCNSPTPFFCCSSSEKVLVPTN
ncbi:hypothetical protein DFS33DRAFT_1275465 [Desarmillaria ectypa]|nr:hypothetical protein DFS33DRAFT_1275465 [Desarmillaria ectypa]